jgi:hypothetical protein
MAALSDRELFAIMMLQTSAGGGGGGVSAGMQACLLQPKGQNA